MFIARYDASDRTFQDSGNLSWAGAHELFNQFPFCKHIVVAKPSVRRASIRSNTPMSGIVFSVCLGVLP